MIHLSIRMEVAPVLRRLDDLQRKQVPFALAKAVTALAFDVQRAERAAMSEVFKRPRPFTQRSVLVTRATKASPTATVYVRPEAARYLQPYETGGVHHAPGKGLTVLVPKGIALDAYGQIRARPAAIAQRAGVFAGRVQTKAGRVWGFWQSVKRGKGRHLKLLIRASDALAVHKKLGFVERARRLVKAQGRAAFEMAIAEAKKTAFR